MRLVMCALCSFGFAGCVESDSMESDVRKPDNQPPHIAIASPTGGATVSGVVAIEGTASDNRTLAQVDVQIDAAPFAPASGTTSWSYAWDATAAAAGSHTITARATDASGNTATSQVTVTVGDGSGIGRGPQPSIACPAGAHYIAPGASIQAAVDGNPTWTTFCLGAGIHPITSPVTPKTGDAFVGEYGAILDGSGWSASVDYYAAIMAHNQDIDDVTIRNLVIRNMPQRCVHAFYQFSDRWVLENNEITGCRSGVSVSNAAVLRRNYIHHNSGDDNGGLIPNGAYVGYITSGVVFEDNEISYNGATQKMTSGANNVTFRNNWIHHNVNGIWFDGDNFGTVIENNLIEDNSAEGIVYEVSGQGVIRNNTIRRSGDSAILVATSRDLEIYGNVMEDNFRAVNLMVNCAVSYPSGSLAPYPPNTLYPGAMERDLRNNNVHDNTVAMGAQLYALTNLLNPISCSAEQANLFTSGSKNNRFSVNHYTVPSVSAPVWYWGVEKTWTQWQAVGQDTLGTVE